jgi:hypothetical protein
MKNKNPSQYREKNNDIVFKLNKERTKGKLFIGNQQVIIINDIERIIFDVDGDIKILEPKQN